MASSDSDDEKVQETKSNIFKLPCLNNEDPITMEDIQFNNTGIRIIFPVVAPNGINDINNYKIPEEGHCFTVRSILDYQLFTSDEDIEERFGKKLLKYPYDRTLIINPEILKYQMYIPQSYVKEYYHEWFLAPDRDLHYFALDEFAKELSDKLRYFNNYYASKNKSSRKKLIEPDYEDFWIDAILHWNEKTEQEKEKDEFMEYAEIVWNKLTPEQRELYMDKYREAFATDRAEYKEACMLDNYIYFKIDTGVRHNGQEIHMLIHAKMFNDKFINTLGQSGCNDVKSKKDELKKDQQKLKAEQEALEQKRQALKRIEESLKLKEESLKEREDVNLPFIRKSDGTKSWYKNGILTRDDDLPAIERPDGTKEWYKNDKRHRDGDLPAIERPDGTKEWYKNDKRHRDGDLPAFEGSDGTKMWYKDDNLFRDNNLPAIEWVDGTKEWYKNGQRHRDGDLPAIVHSSGTKEWYKNGQRHRDGDLPAKERSNGKKEWWINGELVRKE